MERRHIVVYKPNTKAHESTSGGFFKLIQILNQRRVSPKEVLLSLLRSAAALGCYVPGDQIQGLRNLVHTRRAKGGTCPGRITQ